jgi:hypothetical protein
MGKLAAAVVMALVLVAPAAQAKDSGVAAGSGFSRFLSRGVDLDRFRAGTWYRVPGVRR